MDLDLSNQLIFASGKIKCLAEFRSERNKKKHVQVRENDCILKRRRM